MTFLAPWAAWFLAGLPLILLLYLLKVKRRSLPVSTLMFWTRVLQENRRRALFQRLRNLLSLLLQILIFLLILGALAKPLLEKSGANHSATVLIIDTRARMHALDENGQSRFARALQLAAPFVRDAAAQNQIALLSTDASPQVRAAFSPEEKTLRHALESLKATDAGGGLEGAIGLADELLASRKNGGRIVVFTDHPVPSMATRAPIEWIGIGSPRDNIAITRFATRPLLNSPVTSEVLLEIRNFGPNPVSGNLELSFDGRLLDVKPFTLPPNGQKLELFPSLPNPGRNSRGWLTARLDLKDALPGDNIAFAVLPPLRSKRVLLVTKGNWFLEKLLQASQQISFELLSPDTFQLSMADKFDAVILDQFVPPQFSLGQSPGNFLFVDQSPFKSEVKLTSPIVPEIDTSHPVMRLVNLQNVTILRGNALEAPKESSGWKFEVPMRSFDQPLMLIGARHSTNSEQRVAALGFDLAQSDLPLRIAFPILIANTINWLSGESAPPPALLRAGETLPLAANQTVWTKPQTEMGSGLAAPPNELAHGFFQPLHQGYYLLDQPTGQTWIAVNTFSEEESNLWAHSKAAPAANPQPVLRRWTPLTHWAPWQLLALAAIVLSCMEWWFFHRRQTE